MKKIIGMVVGALCMVLVALVFVKPVEAEAAGRNVKITWDTGTNDWYMQINSTYWLATNGTVVSLEDGDVVVVDAAGVTPSKTLNIITDKKLDTLAVTGDMTLTITLSQKIGTIYPANRATLIYNGDAGKVIANAGCITQINGNVDELEATYVSTEDAPIFAVTGTVGTLKAKITDGTINTDIAYDFAAGTVHAYADDKGVVFAKPGTLKGSPSASTNTTTTQNGGKELDQVPKTGNGVSTSLLFFAVAAMLTIAGVTFKRHESVK